MTDDLWIVNQYALRPDQPGGTRHYKLAREVAAHGLIATVIHANRTRRWAQPATTTPGVVEADGGVAFLALPSRGFMGNGMGRLGSTIGFALRVAGLRSPTHRPVAVVGSSPDLLGALGAWVLARRLRVPFILEVRDVWPASLVEIGGVAASHPYVFLLGSIERFLYRHSEAIIGVLAALDVRVAEIAGESHRDKVTWIPNSASVGSGQEVRTEIAGDFVAIYTGAIGTPNALVTLIQAASIIQNRLAPQTATISIHIYGDGVEKGKLVSDAKALGLKNVHFHDPVPKEAIPDLLAKAHVGLLPALKTDLYRYGASPNKLFDYLAAGLPVLTSLKMPSNPVEESACGIVVEPENAEAFANALLQLSATSQNDRHEMGRRGQRFLASRYATTVISRRLVDVVTDARVKGSHPVAGR